jgi:hypothetical protein
MGSETVADGPVFNLRPHIVKPFGWARVARSHVVQPLLVVR